MFLKAELKETKAAAEFWEIEAMKREQAAIK